MKSSKSVYTNNNIDEKHSEMLNYFENIETKEIPRLTIIIDELKLELRQLKKNEIDRIMDIKDEIKDYKLKIKRLKSQKNDYLLENSKYVFQYFEQKKQISTNVNENTNKVLNNNMIAFYKIKANNEENEKNTTEDSVEDPPMELQNRIIQYIFGW